VAFAVCHPGSMVSRCESIFIVAICGMEGFYCIHPLVGFGQGIGITNVIGTRGHVDDDYVVAALGDCGGEVIDM